MIKAVSSITSNFARTSIQSLMKRAILQKSSAIPSLQL